MVTDCPFTVAEVVLMIAPELLGVVPPLLPVLVEPALPQATAINATRSILIPKNARLKVSISNILLANQNQRLVLNIITYARRLHYPPPKEPGVQRTKSFAGVRGVSEKLFFPLLPPQAAKKYARQVSTINPHIYLHL